jgi:hypothetical protein
VTGQGKLVGGVDQVGRTPVVVSQVVRYELERQLLLEALEHERDQSRIMWGTGYLTGKARIELFQWRAGRKLCRNQITARCESISF